MGSLSADETSVTICLGSFARKAMKLRVVTLQGDAVAQTSAVKSVSCAVPRNSVGTPSSVMTMGDRRSSVLPDVPTAIESGFPGFDSTTWYGLFAPKGTPAEVQQGVAAAVREAVKRDDVRKSFATIGAEPVGNTPAEFTAMVQREARRIESQVKRFPLD